MRILYKKTLTIFTVLVYLNMSVCQAMNRGPDSEAEEFVPLVRSITTQFDEDQRVSDEDEFVPNILEVVELEEGDELLVVVGGRLLKELEGVVPRCPPLAVLAVTRHWPYLLGRG